MTPTPDPSVGVFKELWKAQGGPDITDEQAAEYQLSLVRLLKWCLDREQEQRERAPP